MAAWERDDIPPNTTPIEIDIHQASLNASLNDENVSQLLTEGKEAYTKYSGHKRQPSSFKNRIPIKGANG
jgi:hypothetical protein